MRLYALSVHLTWPNSRPEGQGPLCDWRYGRGVIHGHDKYPISVGGVAVTGVRGDSAREHEGLTIGRPQGVGVGVLIEEGQQ